MNYFLKIVLLIVLFSKFVFADKNFKIINVQNNISILDIHGKRYNASPEIIIKTGDFLSSKIKPALIIIGYNKLCFSKQTSIKITSIEDYKNIISLSVVKGKLLIFVNNKDKLKFNINVKEYVIQNNLGHIMISHQKNSHFVKTLQVNADLYTKNSKKMKLKTNNFYFFKNNNLTKNKPINFKKSDFLEKCTEPIYNFKSEKKSNYKCTVSNEKLFCGHQ